MNQEIVIIILFIILFNRFLLEFFLFKTKVTGFKLFIYIKISKFFYFHLEKLFILIIIDGLNTIFSKYFGMFRI